MFDPFLAGTVVLGITSAGLGVALASARASVTEARNVARDKAAQVDELWDRINHLRGQISGLHTKLAEYVAADKKRVAQREDARMKALAAIQVRAAKRRAAK